MNRKTKQTAVAGGSEMVSPTGKRSSNDVLPQDTDVEFEIIDNGKQGIRLNGTLFFRGKEARMHGARMDIPP